MRRIHRQRREHGEDVGAEVFAQTLTGVVGEILVQADADVIGVEFAMSSTWMRRSSDWKSRTAA
jgi:hypothetical protein